MAFDNIVLQLDGPVATLTINRPDKRNAVNNATVEEIDRALAQVESDRRVRVLILTGAGDKAFVAGADIQELQRRDLVLGRYESGRRQEVYNRIERLEIPSIAAINGFALGTGLELAMACTLRIAAAGVKLGQPEIKLGVIPGAGGTQRLRRLVGLGKAMEMILTGEPITAEAALALGLVNRVVPADCLLEETRKLAAALTALPKRALQYAKEAVLRGSDSPLYEGLAHESHLHALACDSEDKREGVAAFLQKRAPKFTGR
jgi:enoyl-CoA hydratase